MTLPSSFARRRALVLLAGSCVLLSACGTRLSEDEVIASANQGATGGTLVDGAGAADGAQGTDSALSSDPGAATGSGAGADAASDTGAAGGSGGGDPGAPGADAGAGSSGTTAAPGDAQGPASGGGPAPAGAAAAGAPTKAGVKTGCVDGAPVLKLGHIGSYSGAIASAMAGGDRVVKAWAQSINDGGCINGQKVQVFTADDGASTSTYLQKTKQMVEDNGVVAFIGVQAPISVQSARSYLEQKKIPIIGGESLGDVWYSSPMYFPTGPIVDHLTFGLAKNIAESKGKGLKVGTLFCVETPICQQLTDGVNKKGGAKRAGLNPVYEQGISLGAPQPQLQSYCIEARERGVQALIIFVDAATFSRIGSACGGVGYNPVYGTSAVTLSASLADNPAIKEIVASQGFFPWPFKGTGTQDYHAALAKYDRRLTPQTSTASAWTGVKLLEKAAAKAPGTGALTSARLLEGLWSLKNDNLGGITVPLSFNKGKAASVPSAECTFFLTMTQKTWRAPKGLACTKF